jgi:hypothetical protein
MNSIWFLPGLRAEGFGQFLLSPNLMAGFPPTLDVPCFWNSCHCVYRCCDKTNDCDHKKLSRTDEGDRHFAPSILRRILRV